MSATHTARDRVTGEGAGRAVAADALVFFGATGDLAYKKIFPALQNMIRRGTLSVPVIGVAKSDWTLEQLRARARDSLATHGGGVDEAAFDKLVGLLQYVDGDYQDLATFQQLRKVLGNAAHPAHYLAIPPDLPSDTLTTDTGMRSFPLPRSLFLARRMASCRSPRDMSVTPARILPTDMALVRHEIVGASHEGKDCASRHLPIPRRPTCLICGVGAVAAISL